MQYKKITSKKIYEIVTQQIQDMVKSGELKPGDKLDSVEQLAKNFNVGRSAVREALSALKAIGLVEMKQGEGTYIKEYDFSQLTSSVASSSLLTSKEIFEFYEVRKIIETGSATLAAQRRTQAELDKMQEALAEMAQASGNEALGEQADVKFHLAIAEATHNSVLIKLMHQISDTVCETMREARRAWLYSEETSLEKLYQEHVSIYKAIEQREASLAQQLMLAHLVKVEEGAKNLLPSMEKKESRQ